MANVTSATKFFPTAKEGFSTTTSGSVASGATTVGLNTVSGYSNGEVVALVIDPTDTTKKQVFTGIVDTAGVQITGVVWTEGTNQTHVAGATVVDYETATAWALYAKGMRVEHTNTGTHSAITATSLSTSAGVTVGSGLIVSAGSVTVPNGSVSTRALSTGGQRRLGLNTKTTSGTVLPTSYTTYCTVAATAVGDEIEISYGANIRDGSSGANRSGHVKVQCDGVDISGSDIIWLTNTSGGHASVNMIITHTPTAASHTWTLQVIGDTASASLLDQAYLRVASTN